MNNCAFLDAHTLEDGEIPKPVDPRELAAACSNINDLKLGLEVEGRRELLEYTRFEIFQSQFKRVLVLDRYRQSGTERSEGVPVQLY